MSSQIHDWSPTGLLLQNRGYRFSNLFSSTFSIQPLSSTDNKLPKQEKKYKMKTEKLSLSHSPKNKGPLLLSSIAPGLLLPSFPPQFLTHEVILQELPDLPPDHDGRGHSVCIIVEFSTPESWTGAPPPWKSFNYLPPTSYTADVRSSLLPVPLACSSRLVL